MVCVSFFHYFKEFHYIKVSLYILSLRAIGNPYHDYEEDDIYDRAPEEAEKKLKLSIRNKTFSGEYYKPISQQHVRKYINRWKK